ncbi:MAG: aldose 1-epimerase family protein [Bacteroidaceae bacterium]|nr:aldose 1-epimerase family protein [Bacteroidaceae bacterium]
MIELKNETLTILISETGAELQSIKDATGKEYLWQADPNYWPRHSPILFPIVCSVNNDTYRVDGEEYHLPRHGFARDREFQVVYQHEDEVALQLLWDDETLKVYPYLFALTITYTLVGNSISIEWQVDNLDEDEIHFQIGGHPAFNIPDMQEGEAQHGRVQLDASAPIYRYTSFIDGTHDMTEDLVETSEEGIIDFNDETWSKDSIQIHRCQTTQAEILDKEGNPVVTVYYETPVCAFWSPYKKNAPFVCVEPWYGVGDYRGFDGEFRDKPLMNHLLPGASFLGGYQIEIG